MAAHVFAFTPSSAVGGVPRRTIRRHLPGGGVVVVVVVASSSSERDSPHTRVPRPDASRSRRGVVSGLMASTWMATWGGASLTAAARPGVDPPPVPDASNSAYIQGLLAKTEANKDRRLIEQQNSNCLKQSRMGIGDCAGLPEEELKAAMDESLRRLERRQAEAAAAAATTTTEEVTVG